MFLDSKSEVGFAIAALEGFVGETAAVVLFGGGFIFDAGGAAFLGSLGRLFLCDFVGERHGVGGGGCSGCTIVVTVG